MYKKNLDARAKLLFCLLNLLFFRRPRCHTRRWILKSLLASSRNAPPHYYMIERLPVRAAILVSCVCTEGASPKVDLTLTIIQDGHP